MKKIAILGAVLALSTSAIADDGSFYVKAGALGGMGHKLFDDNKTISGFKITKDINKYGDFTFGGTLGFGYKVMENVRAEAQAYYFGGPKFKYDLPFNDVVDAIAAVAAIPYGTDVEKEAARKDMAGSTANVKIDVSGPVFTLGGAVDVVSFGPASLYVTGGAGISYVTAKIEGSSEIKSATTPAPAWAKKSDPKTAEYESKVRFAFNAGAGLSFAASDSVAIDVGYLFVNLGKPAKEDMKADKPADKKEWEGNSIMLHNISVGVRFSL
jgi:opacity protein-like surface antigen